MLRQASRAVAGVAADGLHGELDADLLADDHAAGLERLVPGQAPVLPVQLGRGREAHSVLPPRRSRGPLEVDSEGDGPGHVPNGQVSLYLPGVRALRLDPGAAELDERELLGVDEA